ncbi:hypothetical protein [Gimesia panareensis]|uniref:Uncharacterized protein n=1 Tax=Gimesia panareensis TaxID=2527978 RepID=A0A518FN64_9PLAN|nr:hypothetical protein [Gimesia panareensis]QDT26108.1 hypothetical protein Enr10x_14070 [Gimesia panareensis]QDU49044.1 hypothetical protein Pan110_13610 [Gimesia panareensis]QDV17789.1 hypothetical protein Pan153_24440 [Gimesia panareensis]
MNEIVTGIFIWLLKMLGIYLGILIVLTLIIKQWKKKADVETEDIARDQKKRADRPPRYRR